MKKIFASAAAVAALFLTILILPAYGKNLDGPSISGTIFDPRRIHITPTGTVTLDPALLGAGLTVKVSNHATGREYEVYSDETGAFTVENIEPGPYVVTCDYSGLERMIQVATVEPGKTAQVDLLVTELLPTGNVAIEKLLASSNIHGGR